MAKRLFDFTLAAIGLLVLSPLLVVVALWIKADSAGPVFFRQERVGRYGRLFRIHKFRTMSARAEATGPQITIGEDKRITSFGRILRRYKLDELPQLIDVLVGNMSLVGPRPEVPRYVARYPEDVKTIVLSVRPGITDLASIEFRDESNLLGASENPEQDYVEKILPIKLAYYRRYVTERSFWLDLQLIFLTVRMIIAAPVK